MYESKETRAVVEFAKQFLSTAVEFAKQFLSTNVMRDDMEAYDTPQQHERFFKALEQAARTPDNPDTNDFDGLVYLAADFLSRHERLPEWLETFAADVLSGKRKRPTKRGLDKYVNFERDYKLWRATDEVAKAFDLQHYSNNELSEQITAAQIVSLASGCTLDVVIKACKKRTRIWGRNNPQNSAPR